MKDHVVDSMAAHGTLRLLFATEAFSMGTDSPNICRIVHFGVPKTVECMYKSGFSIGALTVIIVKYLLIYQNMLSQHFHFLFCMYIYTVINNAKLSLKKL